MEGVVEDDDRRPAGCRARDLDGVLDRLGARVDEERLLLLAGARRQLGEPAADLDVRLVDPDHEALVEVVVGLRLDRVDDRREAVARVLAADAACEIEERAAVDVGDARAVCVGDDELRRRDACAHVAGALGEDSVVRRGLGSCGHRGSMPQLRARVGLSPRIAQRRAARSRRCAVHRTAPRPRDLPRLSRGPHRAHRRRPPELSRLGTRDSRGGRVHGRRRGRRTGRPGSRRCAASAPTSSFSTSSFPT